MPPFGFLKKKDSPRKEAQNEADSPAASASDTQPHELITLQRAQELLREIDLEKTRRLSVQLEPIKAAIEGALSRLAIVAKEMEGEEIKLEGMEQRHRSVIENSRKTVVTSLRREAAVELVLPVTANDAKKFRERVESLMKRFGEVSGSHSKLLNVFLKKHSARMKREFEDLEEQLSATRSAVSQFEQDRAPIIRCTTLLNSASQIVPTLATLESSIVGTRAEATELEAQVEFTRASVDSLQASDAYIRAQVSQERISELEQKRKENEKEMVELFSHISRLLTKYSYGVDKETNRLLTIMIEEPSRVFDSDPEPFLVLLSSVRSSLIAGNITVKDGEKMSAYLETLIGTLPILHNRNMEIVESLRALAKDDEIQAVNEGRNLESRLAGLRERHSAAVQSIEQQTRQLSQKKNEVGALLAEAESLLSSMMSKKKYEISYS